MKEKNINMDRRTFLKAAGVSSASIAVSSGIGGNVLASEAAKEAQTKAMPTRVLGKSGISVSILSLGGIDWTTNQNLLKMGFTMGATLWDTSDRYENGKSEIGLGQYFAKYPEDRKKVFLCTKGSDKRTPQQISDGIDGSLKNMNTDYIDLYMLTGLGNDVKNLSSEVRTLIENKKKEGKIKLFGFSSHLANDQVIADSLALGWIDALMITYNYILMQKPEVQKQIDACAKAGIGLIAIKSQGRGPDMVETPQALEATKHFMDKGYTLEQAKLKAIWSDERIASICSNINNVTILKDNVAAANDSVKLSMKDSAVLGLLAENELGHYCQGCGKCLTVMGDAARIPDVMRYMMYYNSYGERDRARGLYRELPLVLRNTLALRDYSSAEAVCPHGLQIGRTMVKAASLLA
jgi:uncharacterized protein